MEKEERGTLTEDRGKKSPELAAAERNRKLFSPFVQKIKLCRIGFFPARCKKLSGNRDSSESCAFSYRKKTLEADDTTI